jgi:hypothetical protein
MDTKDHAESFLERLRILNGSAFPGQNKDRGIARETLRLMGDILIRPVLHELVDQRELRLILPIVNLYLALVALERGRIHPLLRPLKNAGRPKGTGASPRVRGGAAAAMEILMRQGARPVEEAARMVARMLDKKRVRQRGGKPIEWTTIRTWRKKINSHRPIAPKDADVFRDCLIPVEIRKVVGRSEDGRLLDEPLDEPRKLAEEALEFALTHPASPPPLWGLEEVDRGH